MKNIIILFTAVVLPILSTAQTPYKVTHIHLHNNGGRGASDYGGVRFASTTDGTAIGLGAMAEWRMYDGIGVGVAMRVGIVDVALVSSLTADSTGHFAIVDPFHADKQTEGSMDIRVGILTQDRHVFGIIGGFAYKDGERTLNYGAYYKMYLSKSTVLRPAIHVAYTRHYGFSIGGALVLVLD
ncbi:MAG: hypothetical protein II793_06505 [Bacteroidales bacterium]|nr:hypothetical protein [Bacteroidales bacterium]